MASPESAAQRYERGRGLRKDVPRSAHGEWRPAADRPDPVEVLLAQDADRIAELTPVRHARLAESPFAFFRGGAAIMAADLAGTPDIGVDAQLCGDAHLANFGAFGSAERHLVFDVNDFDETLPGPWEWDLKRLATSFVIAAQDNGFPDKVGRACAEEAASAYRSATARFASTPILDVWYAQLDIESMRSALPNKAARKAYDKKVAKAKGNDSRRVLGKLVEEAGGSLRFRSNPPLLVPSRDLAGTVGDADGLRHAAQATYQGYLDGLNPAPRSVLERFDLVDMALKVVGVGSVGTLCWIALLIGRDHHEPLFLQVKQAGPSVLEEHLPRSIYADPGRRVVEGQRMIQSGSDVFLGWSTSPSSGRSYYWRQYRDMKGSADVAAMNPEQLSHYATICGWTLARGHAKTGDSIVTHGYMGRSSTFEKAIGEFASAYAGQNLADYEAFTQAVQDGVVQAEEA
jgi:uncharacterized protein (DUF2252 family)